MPEATFPFRVGAVDIGSNAVRFLAVQFNDRLRWDVLAQKRVELRLGHDVFVNGELSAESYEKLLDSLRAFAHEMDDLHVKARRIVATSALRDSGNGNALVESATAEGVDIEIIDGVEEARLVYLAVRNRHEVGDAQWVLADLGGGSLEISVIDAVRVHCSETYPLGAVRLLEEAHHGSETDLRQHVARRMDSLRESACLRDARGLIATGGNIEALASLAQVKRTAAGTSVLPGRKLNELIDRIEKLSVPARITELRLRPDRADVILPAALVYQRVAELARADRIVVPHVGLKEGVVLDLLNRA